MDPSEPPVEPMPDPGPAPSSPGLPRLPLTTTHDPAWGGFARLAVIAGTGSWVDGGRTICHLVDPVSSIGSDPGCEIVLAGLAPRHAWIHHDDDDEYVLDSPHRDVRVNGVVCDGRLQLRTGSRLQIGPHLLAFVRDEYADHGRPYGGREGGEFGTQLPQEPRRSREAPATPADTGEPPD